MCARKDSNLHTRRRCHLKTVRLPISPRAHVIAKMKNKLISRNEKGIYYCYNLSLNFHFLFYENQATQYQINTCLFLNEQKAICQRKFYLP